MGERSKKRKMKGKENTSKDKGKYVLLGKDSDQKGKSYLMKE